MSRCDRESFPNVRERFGVCSNIRGDQGALSDVRVWSGVLPGCPREVWRLSECPG